jgi:Protein of unknown function (DUF4058)
MPVHDWMRVKAGVFHHFHTRWISAIGDALNAGLLPGGYYALTEQIAGETVPDNLTLQTDDNAVSHSGTRLQGTLAVEVSPPRVALMSEADEVAVYAHRQKRLAIRHTIGDKVVAVVEVVSLGIKQFPMILERFVDTAAGALFQGVRLLVIDLFPPGRHDPSGIHGAIWQQFNSTPFEFPAERPLTLAAYAANELPKAYIEPVAIGLVLPDMPLYLTSRLYINVSLERTYMEAYATIPKRWRSVIEGRAG